MSVEVGELWTGARGRTKGLWGWLTVEKSAGRRNGLGKPS